MMFNKSILSKVLVIVLAIAVIPAMAEQTDTDPKPASSAVEPVQDIIGESTEQDFKAVDRFTPSEKLTADDAVSFPVDI
jgi:hypothetical protein